MTKNRKLNCFEIWLRDNSFSLIVIKVIVLFFLFLIFCLSVYFIINKGLDRDDQMEDIRIVQFQREIK